MEVKEQLNKDNWNYDIKEDDYYGYFSLAQYLLKLAKTAIGNNNIEEAELFRFLAQLCCLDFNADHQDDPYKDVQNIVEGKTQQLADIVDEIYEPLLKNRVADVLWLCHHPKNIRYVQIAIEAVISMNLNQQFSHTDILVCWKRATILALKTKQKVNEIHTKLVSEIDNCSDERYFKLDIANIILEVELNKNKEHILAEKMLSIIESNNSTSNEEIMQDIDYLDFAINSYAKAHKFEKKSELNSKKGHYLEAQADILMLDSGFAADVCYKNSLKAFQNIEQQFRQELDTEANIKRVRQKITKANVRGLDSMEVSETIIDISKIMEQAVNHVSGKKSSTEALSYFIGLTDEPHYQKMKETYQPNLMDIVGGMRTVSPTDGRTIAVNNQIDFDNPESIDKCKDNHATFLFMSSIQLIVESTILPALVKLNSEHQITKEMLENLCEQSPIVPPNRQKLMSQALYAGFQQDYYASTHILCPQFEHMIRVMLKDIGVKTTYIANDGIETENGLSSLMKSSEIVDLLGENLCFEIKTIFTDSHGFNLRNDIAHGLLDDEYAVTAGSVYAWHLTLRLIIKSYIGNK